MALDFVAYHMVHKHGLYEVEGRTEFSFDSSKRGTLEKAIGQNVWVISGNNSKDKTRYHLCALFHPEKIKGVSGGGFRIFGKGKGFTPEIEITHLAWFADLYKKQNNFSFGFNEIQDGQIAQQLQEISTTTDTEYYSPDEIIITPSLNEGAPKQVTVNAYERNREARAACVKHYGYLCSVCDFDFEAQYGDAGKEFIHVHHLIPLYSIGKEYKVDPINDLRPVCPNCHAMIHRKNPPYTLEEMQTLVKTKNLATTNQA